MKNLEDVLVSNNYEIINNHGNSGLGRNSNAVVETTAREKIFVKRIAGSGDSKSFNRIGEEQARKLSLQTKSMVSLTSFDSLDYGDGGLLLLSRYLAGDTLLSKIQGISLQDNFADLNLCINFNGVFEYLKTLIETDLIPVRVSRGGPFYIVRNLTNPVSMEALAGLSPAQLRVAGIVQRDGSSLFRDWPKSSKTALSHGDFTLNNILDTGSRYYLIDWEEFGISDRCLDISCFAGDLIYQMTRTLVLKLENISHDASLDILTRVLAQACQLVLEFNEELSDSFSDEELELISRRCGLYMFAKLFVSGMDSSALDPFDLFLAGAGYSLASGDVSLFSY